MLSELEGDASSDLSHASTTNRSPADQFDQDAPNGASSSSTSSLRSTSMSGDREVIPTLRPALSAVRVTSREMWRTWLSTNHMTSAGVWAVTVKKASVAHGDGYVSSVDLNEECLCFGWIDSKPGRVDDRHTALLCTPRKAGSGWSKVNKDRLRPLLENGRVAPAGLAAIEAAKADGSWSRLDSAGDLSVPDDLTVALDAHPPAAEFFDAFPPSTRRAVLEWIAGAKTPATRAKRIAETARLAQENRRANPVAASRSRHVTTYQDDELDDQTRPRVSGSTTLSIFSSRQSSSRCGSAVTRGARAARAASAATQSARLTARVDLW